MSEQNELSKEQIEQKISKALEHLREYDLYLLEKNVNERSISHKLASYLQDNFNEGVIVWHVDCEYNRNGDYPKQLRGISPIAVASDDTDGTTVYPDIIVHKRGEKRNLLVIEIKKANSKRQADDYDLTKLAAYKVDPQYKYEFAVFLKVKTGSNPEFDWKFV